MDAGNATADTSKLSVATTAAGASEPTSPNQDACAASSTTEGANNASKSNVLPVDMVKLLVQEAVSDFSKIVTQSNTHVLKELKEIKEAQAIGQRDIAGFKKERETDREMYRQLQDQYMKLKQKNEDTTTRLKVLNMDKCELQKNLGKLESHRTTLQQEVERLKEDAENHLSDNQCKEREIERLNKRISELEEIIASINETHKVDAVQICDLKDEIETLKEEKGHNELSNKVEELKEQNDKLMTGESSYAHDMKFGRELTMQSIASSIEPKGMTESPRFTHHMDMRRSRPALKSFNNSSAYTTPRQQAFVGTSSSKASHNIVHKRGQKFASWERHQ